MSLLPPGDQVSVTSETTRATMSPNMPNITPTNIVDRWAFTSAI